MNNIKERFMSLKVMADPSVIRYSNLALTKKEFDEPLEDVELGSQHTMSAYEYAIDDHVSVSFATVSPHWRILNRENAEYESYDDGKTIYSRVRGELVAQVESKAISIGGVTFRGACTPVVSCGFGFIGNNGVTYDCACTGQIEHHHPVMMSIQFDMYHYIKDGVIVETIVEVNRSQAKDKLVRFALQRMCSYAAFSIAIVIDGVDAVPPVIDGEMAHTLYSYRWLSEIAENFGLEQKYPTSVFIPDYAYLFTIQFLALKTLQYYKTHEELLEIDRKSDTTMAEEYAKVRKELAIRSEEAARGVQYVPILL